jgi:hypothetical protein
MMISKGEVKYDKYSPNIEKAQTKKNGKRLRVNKERQS